MTKHKFAVIGTSCAGKTTLTYALVARLKSYGVLVDGVFSQDRKFSFPISKIESEAAQNWMVANLIAKEADLYLHDDVSVLVSDRSPLDLMAYYAAQYETELSRAALNYAIEWSKGYTAVYYLAPLPYQDDNKRPPDEFRLRVDAVLQDILQSAEEAEVAVVRPAQRSDVLRHLMQSAGIRKPGVKDQLVAEDVQRLCNTLRLPIMAKFPSPSCDTLSDTDLWVVSHLAVATGFTGRLTKLATEALRGHCGPWPQFDVMVASTAGGLPLNAVAFYPENTP